jgi:exosortase H (IPTLxxWG-CTERM-specific)
LFSDDVEIYRRTVTFDGFPLKIVEECVGVYEAMVFAVAVVSFPTRWRKKLLGLALGIPLVFAFNLLRIATLLAIGRYHSDLFDFVHLYLWQGTLLLFMSLVWLLWVWNVVGYEEDPVALR